VKILGRGALTKKIAVKANAVSAGARKKIEEAGGTVELIEIPQRPKRRTREAGTEK
jgi:large subunit ribosomal protein L15